MFVAEVPAANGLGKTTCPIGPCLFVHFLPDGAIQASPSLNGCQLRPDRITHIPADQDFCKTYCLGPPVVPFYPFFGGGFPY